MLLKKFKISGHSMQPTLRNGEIILASGFPYLFNNPAVNDIVAFKDKKYGILIKRIKIIKNGKYHVAGDNIKDSLDSENFGFIEKKQILGKFIYKL